MAYATLDPSNKSSQTTLSGGNLTAQGGGGSFGYNVSSTATLRSSGQWYYEVTWVSGSMVVFGIENGSWVVGEPNNGNAHSPGGDSANGYGVRTDLRSLRNGAGDLQVYTGTWATGDVLGVKLDLDAGTLEVTQNGVSRGTYTGITAGTWRPAFGMYQSGQITVNFGASAWAYAPGGSYAGWTAPGQEMTASFERMTAAGSAPSINSNFSLMTASASVPPSISASFEAMTAAASAAPSMAASFEAMTAAAIPGTRMDGTFEEMTATGTGIQGTNGILDVDFRQLTATSTGSAGSVGAIDADFEAMSASWYGEPGLQGTFEAMSASGTGLVGTVASMGGFFRAMAAAGAGSGYGIGMVSAQFQPMSALGAGNAPTFGTVDAAFRALRAQGSALVGSAGAVVASFEEMEPALVGTAPTVGAVDASFERLRGSGRGGPALASTSRAWAMNASNEAVTEYQAYPFSGFAELDGRRFGAGPSGIYLLSGDDDEGANIDWSFRTGFMDGTGARGVRRSLPADDLLRKKRLDEVLMSLRFDGPLRMRVWTDEDTYFDYNVPNYRPDVIHQVRAKLGRGLLSRFYRVEVSGVDNAAIELATMELPMTPANRRLG